MAQQNVAVGLTEAGAAHDAVQYPGVLSTLMATASGVKKLTVEEIAEVGAAVGRGNLDASTWPDALPQIVKLQADMVRADLAQWNTVAQLSELAKDTLVALAEGFDVPYEGTKFAIATRVLQKFSQEGVATATTGAGGADQTDLTDQGGGGGAPNTAAEANAGRELDGGEVTLVREMAPWAIPAGPDPCQVSLVARVFIWGVGLGLGSTLTLGLWECRGRIRESSRSSACDPLCST